jgi:ferredoxin
MLENAQEMPAWSWEQTEAREEGVEFVHRRGPVEVIVVGGRLTGLRLRGVTRVFDQDKRFDPQYDDADRAVLDCDTVILAIGQQADMGFLAGSDLACDARGRLVFDPRTHQTSRANVFACGEIVTAPGSVVEACAHGQRAARAMDLYLSGAAIVLDDSLPPAIGKIDPPTAGKVTKVDRQAVPTEPGEARRCDFAEMDHCYAEPAALAESRRCMSCGAGAEVLADKCAACLSCLRVCPFDIPKVGETARIDSALCQACGMCIAECPANAIVYRGRPVDLYRQLACAALGNGARAVAFICGHHASATDWRAENGIDDVQEIYLPSLAGLDVRDIMQAIEEGARRVLVVAARPDTERYPKVAHRLRSRVRQARGLLAEIGLSAQIVRLVELA